MDRPQNQNVLSYLGCDCINSSDWAVVVEDFSANDQMIDSSNIQ
jgi:hypothetical protein